MDLMILRGRLSSTLAHFQEMMEPFHVSVRRFRLILRKSSKVLVAFLVALPFLVLAVMVYKEPILLNSSNTALSKAATTTISQPIQNSSLSIAEMSILKFPSSGNQSSASTRVAKDKLLGGLLSPGFPEETCISRYSSFLYHKTSPHKPSTFLLSKLRNYEKLHKLFSPNSKLYKERLLLLLSGKKSRPGECKYVVWIAYSGLGNRILTIASAFLYALLTNRVLLIEQQPDMADLFCEPFPDTSWSLPMDFPYRKNFSSFDQKYARSHGNLLKKNVMNSFSEELNLSSLYLHLAHDYDDHDKLFFCDEHQALLREVPWLIMRTDNYFVPSLFLMQSFEQELIKLFPNKETIFYHLGRYLFHPSNQVWGLITRYYQAYLSKADETIGMQIRIIDTRKSPFQSVMDQILSCTKKEKLLPEIDTKRTVSSEGEKNQQTVSKAVLVTSLYSGFFENIKNKYWTHPTVNGEVVGVYQPSHEEEQKYENNMHNMKAWAEMYLLSMCDVLVTSGWSTFGYVAQGLGGLRPWILYKIENQAAPDPPCGRVMSMEPCFHSPPIYHCKTKEYVDNGALAPHVRHCEDMNWGLKLFDSHQ